MFVPALVFSSSQWLRANKKVEHTFVGRQVMGVEKAAKRVAKSEKWMCILRVWVALYD